MRTYIPASEVKAGDAIVRSYGLVQVHEVHETPRGLIGMIQTCPITGQSEQRDYRKGTWLIVERPAPPDVPMRGDRGVSKDDPEQRRRQRQWRKRMRATRHHPA